MEYESFDYEKMTDLLLLLREEFEKLSDDRDRATELQTDPESNVHLINAHLATIERQTVAVKGTIACLLQLIDGEEDQLWYVSPIGRLDYHQACPEPSVLTPSERDRC
jgi:hypothetical protein